MVLCLIVKIVWLFLITKSEGFENSHISHTHSLPLDIFNTCNKIVLVSPFEEDTCCGTVIKFKSKLGILDLAKCSKYVTCKGSPDFRKEIIQTTCKKGMQMSGGCLYSNPNSTGSGSRFTTTCFCTSLGLMCPDQLHPVTCDNLQNYIIGHDDEYYVVEGASNTSMTVLMEPKLVPIHSVGEEKKPVEFDSASVSNNKVEIKLKNALNQECQIFIDKEPCKFLCKTDDCSHSCNIPEKDKTINQIKLKVMCGSLMKTMWLFRSEKDNLSIITGHGSWRSHSKTIGILLLLDIAFGYVFFRLLVGLSYYCYNLVCIVLSAFNNSIHKYVLGSTIGGYGRCKICSTHFQNVYDAYLHDIYCIQGLCPYCKETNEVDMWHINSCEHKGRAISYMKNEKKQEIEEKVKQATKDLKMEVWRNKLTMNRIPTKIWCVSLVGLIILLIISPSSALMNKPCTRLVGRTAKCSSRSDSESLGNDVDEHNYWSQVELGMLDKLEEKHVKDEFVSNAIHRMKTNFIHLSGNSAQSVNLQGMKCKSNGLCRAITEIKWVSDAFKGNIQMFETKEKNYHKSTLNIFLADLEVVFPLFKEYSTSDWKVEVNSKFSCVNPDCSNLCNTNFEKNKCLVKKETRSKDTSWAHNPVWCWSINSGCTCMEAFIKQKPDGNVYDVFKTGDGVMKGLLCIEHNSAFINCIVIDRTGTYELGKNRLQVNKWSTNEKAPKKIIVEMNMGSNTSKTQAKTGPSCERENCNAGDAGDWQFDTISKDCSSQMYFNPNGLSSSLLYEFAHSPEWEMSYPKYGSARYSKYNWVGGEGTDHHVDLEKNSLVYTEGNFGSFSMDLTVTDMEIFEVIDNSEITEFKVKRCVGEYMSRKGSICTFLATLQGAEKTNVRIVPNDDSLFIQNDMQMLTSGQNGFRKFMYVRNKQNSYSFCLEHKGKTYCDSIKYNLTEPKHTWSVSPSSSSYGKNSEKIEPCDLWFGLGCMFNRIIDFFKTMWSAVWVVVIGLIVYLLANFLSKLVRKKYQDSEENLQEVTTMNNLNDSIKLLVRKRRQ
uniref:Glycoprotein n=1 Tax=Neotermes castaneus bunya-like virus 1 TaxID=3133466 RepID=A0AAT9JH08_9VIRU